MSLLDVDYSKLELRVLAQVLADIHPENLVIGDPIIDSPVGPGTITGFTDAGYPRVNHIAVTYLRRLDGAQFDPFNKQGGTHGPTRTVTGRIPSQPEIQEFPRNVY